ncbi:hypothetical protein [Francisella tularensis]|uniref:hypothetical protein n=1 Tax=Francisella tularensis TaxID=263 RepID=UPI001CC2D355
MGVLSNYIANSQAIMVVKIYYIVNNELLKTCLNETQAKKLAAHKGIPGNRPRTTILLDELRQYSTSTLNSLYENKIFVHVVLWEFNSY